VTLSTWGPKTWPLKWIYRSNWELARVVTGLRTLAVGSVTGSAGSAIRGRGRGRCGADPHEGLTGV
jgi:hypothetical protein